MNRRRFKAPIEEIAVCRLMCGKVPPFRESPFLVRSFGAERDGKAKPVRTSGGKAAASVLYRSRAIVESLRTLPIQHGHGVDKIIEAEINFREHLAHHNYLAGVH
jgi:hypothetical protein